MADAEALEKDSPLPGEAEAAAPAAVPVEGPRETQQDYGPNNEDLPDELVSALLQLHQELDLESVTARRLELIQKSKAHSYWQGNQNIWLDYGSMQYRLPYEGQLMFGDQKDIQEQPRYDYVLNVYQPFGLAFVAAFAASIPKVSARPRSAQREADLTGAKAAQKIAQLIEDQNQIAQKMIQAGLINWLDGKIGGYVRYVADAERFGRSDVTIPAEAVATIGEDTFSCPKCGESFPAQMFQGLPRAYCMSCKTPMGDDDFHAAPRVKVPSVGSTDQVANGQVRIDFFGSMMLRTPMYAADFWDYEYLTLEFEVPKSRLQSMWPKAAEKIEAASAIAAEDQYARLRRLAAAQSLPILMPGDALAMLDTYTQSWLRPWAFNRIRNKDQRERLLQLFPDGAYVAFAGTTYCGSRGEPMSRHWRTWHALPGDGQNRPAVGEASLELQDQINVLANMAVEAFEYGIPPVYVDSEVLDLEAMTERTVEPGVHVPVKPKQGQAVETAFFQPAPAQVNPALFEYLQELMGPVFQLLTGITAAVFGGQMEGVKTAKAYQQARDMSLGRIGTPRDHFGAAYAELMTLAVRCLRDNAADDVERVVGGEDGSFESQVISLADLAGEFEFVLEEDDSYPLNRQEKAAALTELMGTNDPQIMEMLADPVNVGAVKRILGLDDLTAPGEDGRIHQMRETEEMLKTGQVVMPGLFEDHSAHLAELKRWFDADPGQEAKRSNPQGYAAQQEHAQLHEQMMAQRAAASSPAPAAAPVPPGAPAQPTNSPV